jgi:hypothetical protein
MRLSCTVVFALLRDWILDARASLRVDTALNESPWLPTEGSMPCVGEVLTAANGQVQRPAIALVKQIADRVVADDGCDPQIFRPA